MKTTIKKTNILLLWILILFVGCGKKSGEATEANDAKGTKIIETGELAAIDTRSIIMQHYGRYWYQMKIIGILKHGSIVQQGDSIIQLDATEIKKYIIDRESQLETQRAVLEKIQVNQSNRESDLESSLNSELASYNLKKLELESTRFESERTKKIKQLEFEQAKISLKKVKEQKELDKTIAADELKIEKIKLAQLQNEIKSAYDILPALTIRSPISGIFQIENNRRTGEMIKIGDELYRGNTLANVPDLTWMKVNTYISENDFLKIKLGQKVIVRLDALPKVAFEGEINYIGKLCHLKDEKSRQKIFDVEVNLLKPDERLKPGMTVSCEYIKD